MASITGLIEDDGIRLAIEGCGHGTLHAIYASITEACKIKGWPGVDLLIIGGDFQSVRNAYDLNCVSMPAHYRQMCDFHEYYSGARTAPYLTVFIGGNHEASNYLFELHYGGWVAPNIYYLGAANVVRLGSLRIAGMSGIWKGYNYRKSHFERLPYSESDLKSIYHTREMDVRKLLQIRTQVDVGISHDWPKGVEWKGNWKQLFRSKRHLEEDARNGQLGSVAAMQVIERLRPRYWFSAHLHCKYAAVVKHDQDAVAELPAPSGAAKNEDEIDLDEDEINDDDDNKDSGEDHKQLNSSHEVQTAASATNADEIDLELEDGVNVVAPVAPGQGMDGIVFHISQDERPMPVISAAEDARAALPESFRRQPRAPSEPVEHPPDVANKTTRFLALDKCLPNRHFLQLMKVPSMAVDAPNIDRPLKLSYDPEWLAITRTFALTEPGIFGDPKAAVPQAKSNSEYKILIEAQGRWINEHISDADLAIPEDFAITAPVYDGGEWNLPQYNRVDEFPNPQTARYCQMLQIPNPLEIDEETRLARMAAGPRADPETERFQGNGRGGSRGGNRGHGGFRGGRGRGRGRGRYRGR